MKITIITVAYNAVKTIKSTLLSVAQQNFHDIEHVVVDGGSSDGTQAVVLSHSDRISRFLSERDHGIYDAMNKGLALATGDVIGFLNADDTYANENVLSIVAETMKHYNLDALFGDVTFCQRENPDRIVRRYSSSHFRPDRIAWGWMPAHPALFVKQEVFQRAGPFRTDYRIAGDFEFVARVFGNQSLCYRYLPEVLVKMRLGGISTGGWRNSLLLNREVLRACRENGIYTNPLMIFSKYPVKILEFLRR